MRSTPEPPAADGAVIDRAPLAADRLRRDLLAPAGPVARLIHAEEIDSTNAELQRREADCPDFTVMVAEAQSAGRGRLGRQWLAPPRAALLLSVLWRRVTPAAFAWLPLAAGAAVVDALRATTGLPVGLKWPNDVLLEPAGAGDTPGWGRRRKVAGVLVEGLPIEAGGASRGVVIGIGINVDQGPSELPVPWATSLRAASDAALNRTELLKAVVLRLAIRYDGLANGDVSDIRKECTDLLVGIDQTVKVSIPGGGQIVGSVAGLDNMARLMLRTRQGQDLPVEAGDVTFE